MPRFAANVSMLFTELPFLERFEAAASEGFEAVEFLFPYDFSKREIKDRLRSAGLTLALFNLAPGNWVSGERGLAALTGREEEFRASLPLALEYAEELDCQMLHAMAGNARDDRAANQTYVANIRYAADHASDAGVSILLEPINRRDMPGYFLGSVAQAARVLEQIDRDNVRLQLDLYHAQITDGDIIHLIQDTLSQVAHIQIASVPERNEPVSGELFYPYVLAALDQAGYEGWVGCEYHPSRGTREGLAWLDDYKTAPVVARK